MIGQFKKAYLHRLIKILHFLTHAEIQKCLTKYFNFFNNKPPASWVAHITRDFLTCHSYSTLFYSIFITLLRNERFLNQCYRVSPISVFPTLSVILTLLDIRVIKKKSYQQFILFYPFLAGLLDPHPGWGYFAFATVNKVEVFSRIHFQELDGANGMCNIWNAPLR